MKMWSFFSLENLQMLGQCFTCLRHINMSLYFLKYTSIHRCIWLNCVCLGALSLNSKTKFASNLLLSIKFVWILWKIDENSRKKMFKVLLATRNICIYTQNQKFYCKSNKKNLGFCIHWERIRNTVNNWCTNMKKKTPSSVTTRHKGTCLE